MKSDYCDLLLRFVEETALIGYFLNYFFLTQFSVIGCVCGKKRNNSIASIGLFNSVREFYKENSEYIIISEIKE